MLVNGGKMSPMMSPNPTVERKYLRNTFCRFMHYKYRRAGIQLQRRLASVAFPRLKAYYVVMENIIYIFLGAALTVNAAALFVMWQDKRKAVKDPENRTPEVILFLWSICLGSLGILLGMFIFRHKIRKWYFMVGVPVSLLQNMIVFWALFQLR